MHVNELAAIVGAAAAFQAAFITPVAVAIWRLGSKVERHAVTLEQVIIPRLAEHANALNDHGTRIREIERAGVD